jgi:hypothetical protein
MTTTSVSPGRHRRTKGGRHRASRRWVQNARFTVAFTWARVSDSLKAAGKPPLDPERLSYLLGQRDHEPLRSRENRAAKTIEFVPVPAPARELSAVAS